MKRLSSFLISALAAVTGFIGTAAVLQKIDPLQGLPDVQEQVKRTRIHPETTAIFLGSSLTRRGVIPTVFDERLQHHGVSSHSLNCGIDGMTMPEVLFLVDQILQRPPPSLKWFILEASPIRIMRDPGDATKRDIYWRTTPLTMMLLEKIAAQRPVVNNAKSPSSLTLGTDALELWFRHLTNLGRISDFTRPVEAPLPPLSATFKGRTFLSDARGFLGIDDTLPPESVAKFEHDRQQIDSLWANAVEDKVAARALIRLTRRLSQRGIRLVIFQPPDTRRGPAPFPSLADHGVVALNFMQPARYPEIYSPENRYDSRHLNRNGARLFSMQLADELSVAFRMVR